MNNPSSKKKLIFDINNKTTTDPNEIATGFNNFFVTIDPQPAKNTKSDINPLSYVKSVNNSMVLTDVSSTEVRNVVASLKNSSSGYDEFPPFVGKSCISQCAWVPFYVSPDFSSLINLWYALLASSHLIPQLYSICKLFTYFKGT